MTERRSLVEGVKESSKLTKQEEEFIYGDKRSSDSAPATTAIKPSPATSAPTPPILPQMTGRIPVTTRCRPEVASAIKRVSLQRQLAGIEPYTVQDIMEEAFEHWLALNEYT